MTAHMAVGVSCGGLRWNFALTQPQRPGLAAGTEGAGTKKWEGLRWLASANTKTRGVKTSEIWMGSMTMLAAGFFRGKSCWVSLQSKSLGTMVTYTV